MKKFLDKADELYKLSGFKSDVKYGLLKKTIDDGKELLKLTVLRSAKRYVNVKRAWVEFADNPNIFQNVQVTKKKDKNSEDDIEVLCRQLADMRIMLARQQRTFGKDVNRHNNQLDGRNNWSVRTGGSAAILKQRATRSREMTVYESEEDIVLVKRLATGELAQKQVRFDREGDELMHKPAENPARRRPVLMPRDRPPTKKKIRETERVCACS